MPEREKVWKKMQKAGLGWSVYAALQESQTCKNSKNSAKVLCRTPKLVPDRAPPRENSNPYYFSVEYDSQIYAMSLKAHSTHPKGMQPLEAFLG